MIWQRGGAVPVIVAAATRRHDGFTLVEVVITLGVLAIGLALASRLLIESQLGLVRTAAELGNPMPRYALERLRSDLAQAEAVPAALPVPPGVAIVGPAAHLPRWWSRRMGRSDAGEVERTIFDSAGRPAVRHVALRDVAEWRWRPATSRLVDVEVRYRARDTSRVPLADVARTWSPPTVEREVWLRTSLRAEANAP